VNGAKRRSNQSGTWGYRIHDGAAAFRFELAGALSSSDVPELDQCWRTAASSISGKALIVDLNALSGVDEAGCELLHRWREAGAEFVADSQTARAIAESVTGQPVPGVASARSAECGRPALQSVLRISVALLALLLLASVWAESGRTALPPDAGIATIAK